VQVEGKQGAGWRLAGDTGTLWDGGGSSTGSPGSYGLQWEVRLEAQQDRREEARCAW